MVYLYICLGVILFLITFKIQQYIFRRDYFSSSDILDGVVSFKMFIARVGIIVFENLFVYLLLDYILRFHRVYEVILVSNFIGSLLIAWPLLYAPRKNTPINNCFKNMIFIYGYCFVFIFISMLSACASIYLSKVLFHEMSLIQIWENYGVGFAITVLFTISFGSMDFLHRKIHIISKGERQRRAHLERSEDHERK